MLVFDFKPRSYGATAMSYRHMGLVLDIDQEKLLDPGSCGDRLASRGLVPFPNLPRRLSNAMVGCREAAAVPAESPRPHD
jgi:hypothetical protein